MLDLLDNMPSTDTNNRLRPYRVRSKIGPTQKPELIAALYLSFSDLREN
jgi:hypothetical protein